MKLENLKLKGKVLSKEAMSITFGGYTNCYSNCSVTGGCTWYDCGDVQTSCD